MHGHHGTAPIMAISVCMGKSVDNEREISAEFASYSTLNGELDLLVD